MRRLERRWLTLPVVFFHGSTRQGDLDEGKTRDNTHLMKMLKASSTDGLDMIWRYLKATSWLGAGDEHGANRKVIFQLLFVILGHEGIVNHGRVWDVNFVVPVTPSLISRANHARGVLRVPIFPVW